MQFKHPELLYALLLLLIPIIVHLFQLRRFQKVPFTNVEFLKNVTLQTRKSQQLKKWLTLLTRLLLFAAVILAFAQPFISKSNSYNTETETVIYLDNSFSMQAKGGEGELLKRAVQDILSSIEDDEELTLFTNNLTFKNVSSKSLRNDLLQLDYSNNQFDISAAIIKGQNLFNKNSPSVKNFIFVSDFQQKEKLSNIDIDSSITSHFVQLKPRNTNNISIDSVYISNQTVSNIELNVIVNKNDDDIENIPVSLYNNNELVAKTAINMASDNKAIFTIVNNSKINGKFEINDIGLQFDNTFFFNLNERPKINVLSINASTDDFLQHVFTNDEFNYESVEITQLNYNEINKQNLIILNELKSIPIALTNALNAFISNSANVIIIPSDKIDVNSYNQLLRNNINIEIDSLNQNERKVTNINYSHPVFKDVFDKKVSNFQYPKVNTYFEIRSNTSSLLNFEDGKPFLTHGGNIFFFTSALNLDNSNFSNSPLIVPTLYNIGRQSFKLPKLFYTIGEENIIEINTTIQQDDILRLKLEDNDVIPQQRTFKDKVVITTLETPEKAGIYDINNKIETLDHVSFNYNRNESELIYHDISNLKNIRFSDSIPELFNSIKSDTNINALWKWFAIFALILLIIEMLILKFIK